MERLLAHRMTQSHNLQSNSRLPLSFYSDKHSAFRINKPEAKGGQGMTHFGRALA